MPEDAIECESFTVISTIFYLFTKANISCNYLDNCAYKIVDKWMIYYLGENPFETDKD